MKARCREMAPVLSLAILSAAVPASAFDARTTFAKGTWVISPEGAYGSHLNDEGFLDATTLRFWTAGLRASRLPFGPTGSGPLFGALETGLEPFYQRYVTPKTAFFAGLGGVVRYHFLSLGSFVPYAELAGFAGGTDLKVQEIRSEFVFLLLGGIGAGYLVTETMALYAGYRLEHVSNGNTSRPNRGFESHLGLVGVSFYLK